MSDAGLRFELLNAVAESEVRGAKFVIYAHVCPSGTYIGRANDPVGRWRAHCQEAENLHGTYHDDPFKKALRGWRTHFKHYILATASSEAIAASKEAAAIRFYEPGLNARNEDAGERKEYGFKCIDGQLGRPVILQKKARSGGSSGVSGSLKEITARVIFEYGRKRLVCIEGQPFSAGLMVNCSKKERERFSVGDLVVVSVASSEDGRYLIAPATARIELLKT